MEVFIDSEVLECVKIAQWFEHLAPKFILQIQFTDSAVLKRQFEPIARDITRRFESWDFCIHANGSIFFSGLRSAASFQSSKRFVSCQPAPTAFAEKSQASSSYFSYQDSAVKDSSAAK